MSGGEKGGLKRKETDLCSYLFPKCSPQHRHPQRFTELDWEEKGKEGDRGVLSQKTESQNWESNQHTSEQKWELNIGFLNVQNLYHILKNKD